MRTRDTGEFAEFFSARFDTYRRVAHALCGDWGEAEEITQESFVKVYARWSKIRRDTADAYVRKVLTRSFLDTRRRKRAREDVVAEVPDTGSRDPETAERLALGSALLSVPPRQRAVLVLRFIADQSVEQVAATMGCSVGTVKSQTSRGLDTLRAAYPETTRTA